MLFRSRPKHGATPIGDRPAISRHHLLAVAALSAVVAIGAAITPSGDVNAKRSVDETALENIQPGAPEAADTPADDSLEAAELDAVSSVDTLTEAAPSSSPVWEEFIVRSGDNLSLLFKRAGFSTKDVYQIIHTAPQGRDLERIYPGQSLAFQRDEEGNLAAVRHTIDGLQSVLYRRMDGGFSSERTVREPEVRQAWAAVEIESSLFLAGRGAGLSSNLILEAANVLGGVIDFVLDPRKGDTMEVLYEELYLDGEKYSDGKVIATAYTNRGERFEAYRYVDSNGMASYYSPDGVSMRKAFLMAPVDFTRISSNFNPRRLHPIYKTVRPHNGTDYAAPRGTPVFAAGDGRVVKAGYSRPNGNYVFIQHGERFVTKYLHLNKRKVKVGQRVVQSQVIGTVGSTGSATGPHLHYEFLVDGRHRNPRTIHKDLPKAKSLALSEMPRFELAIANAVSQLAALRDGKQPRPLGLCGKRGQPLNPVPTEGLYLGLMSGTSIDGIDAALVRISPDGFDLVATHSTPFSESLGERTRSIARGINDDLDTVARLDRELAYAFADAALELLAGTEYSASAVRGIGSHGQTVRHHPAEDATARYTVQLGDPSTIAERTGISTVADFRRRDIAAGGEGAPLVPAFHAARFGAEGTRRAIVNIGGIANATLLDGRRVVAGFDCGPGNTLLDAWVRKHRGEAFDAHGAWSAEHGVDSKLLERLCADPYHHREGPRSTGPEYFNLAWLETHLEGTQAPGAVQATLCEFTARTIVDSLLGASPEGLESVFICGGGSRNTDLMRRMDRLLGTHDIRLGTTDELGLAAEWVEACAFAWLAARTLEGLSGNEPVVTGAAGPRVLGGIYPGATPA